MFAKNLVALCLSAALIAGCGQDQSARKTKPSSSPVVDRTEIDTNEQNSASDVPAIGGEEPVFSPTREGTPTEPNRSNDADRVVSAKRSPVLGDEKILLAVVSGWNSCDATSEDSTPNPRGMNIYPHVADLKEKIAEATGREVGLFVSCLTKGIKEHSFYASQSSTTLVKDDAEALTAAIKQRADADGAEIVLIGHSYGGWFAMQMASALNADDQLAALVTVDPISASRCQAKDIVGPLLGSTAGGASGCTSPPQNEPGINLNKTALHAGSWLNLWQADFFNVLRSGPVPNATNKKILHASLDDAINGHIEMGLNPTTWSTVFEWLDL